MTVSDTFSDWYERMKSAISETIGPGQQKGEELDSCVRQVMAQGHDRESAYAICNDTLKADLEKSERDELLDTAREMSKYDPQVPLTFGNLVEYAGVDVKGEDELELPKSCRRCNTATRVKGSFMCPDCDPSINPDRDEYELVGSGVQEAKGEDEEETEKADDQAAAPTRKVYLTPSTVDEAPGDAQVKSDDRGLYYEESVDGVDQKADPMANGHDLDPATGEGTCEKTGETITAETMQDLAGDCPHCGEALSVIDSKAAVPDNAVSIDSRDEAPEGAKVIEGDRGGLYYVPEGDEVGAEPGDPVTSIEDVSEGDIVQIDLGEVELRGGDEYGDVYGENAEVEVLSAREVPATGEQSITVTMEKPSSVTGRVTETIKVPGDGEFEGITLSGDDEGEPESPVEQSAQEASEELGIGVNYDGFSEEQAAATNKALAGLDEEGMLDEVSTVSTAPPNQDWGEEDMQDTNAFMQWPDGNVYLNPEQFDEESLQEQEEEGQIAVGTPAGTLAHEIGHMRHYDNLEETGQFDEVDNAELTGGEQVTAETMVSYYAMTNPAEFVSEVHAMLVTGNAGDPDDEFSDWDSVMEAYEKYGGPEVNT